MKLAKDRTRMRVCLGLGMAFVVLVLGISHYLQGAKPAAPALRMEGKINIVTRENAALCPISPWQFFGSTGLKSLGEHEKEISINPLCSQ